MTDIAVRPEIVSARADALPSPSRVRMLTWLFSRAAASVTDLTNFVGLSQPTVTHHMKRLHRAGLVTRFKSGRHTYYQATRLARSAVKGLDS